MKLCCFKKIKSLETSLRLQKPLVLPNNALINLHTKTTFYMWYMYNTHCIITNVVHPMNVHAYTVHLDLHYVGLAAAVWLVHTTVIYIPIGSNHRDDVIIMVTFLYPYKGIHHYVRMRLC